MENKDFNINDWIDPKTEEGKLKLGNRFKVINGSEHTCCLDCSVIDSATNETFCECPTRREADVIAHSLNLTVK